MEEGKTSLNSHNYNPEGRPPKFDYDGDEFYEEIYALAMQGANNKEIAYGLEDRFGKTLTPSTFGHMIKGTYQCWTKEENEKYGTRLRRVLERARSKINQVVRGRYLKAALGGLKTKNKSTTARKLRIDGHYTEDEEIQTTTSEIELPPNMQALATWLFHHDPEWRKIQRGEDEREGDVKKAEVGKSIEDWLEEEERMNE